MARKLFVIIFIISSNISLTYAEKTIDLSPETDILIEGLA
jgi:hypothetical protein